MWVALSIHNSISILSSPTSWKVNYSRQQPIFCIDFLETNFLCITIQFKSTLDLNLFFPFEQLQIESASIVRKWLERFRWTSHASYSFTRLGLRLRFWHFIGNSLTNSINDVTTQSKLIIRLEWPRPWSTCWRTSWSQGRERLQKLCVASIVPIRRTYKCCWFHKWVNKKSSMNCFELI